MVHGHNDALFPGGPLRSGSPRADDATREGGAAGDGASHRPSGGGGRPAPPPGRRLLLAVHLLQGSTPALGACSLRPDRCGPAGTEVSGHPRDAQRGSVTLTTVGLLAPHLTAENHRDLLERAWGKSKRAVEELLAALAPQPPVPAVVRRLPTPRFSSAASALTAAPPPPQGRPATVAPVAPARYKVQFTATAETYEKLRLAQDLLRHQIPDGDLDQVLSRALTALLEQLARERFAATDRPPRRRPAGPRIAAHSGRGKTGGLAAGRGAVRVRGGIRAPLHRDGLPGVPPRNAH